MPRRPPSIAVVTGSSSGLGFVSCIALASEGYTVIASMRDLSRAEALIVRARSCGVAERIEVRACDVTKHEEVERLIAGVTRDFGRIDLLLNNAGFAMAGFAEDLTIEELRAQFETNFFGQVAMTKAALPVMRKQRSGKILMMSSSSGQLAIPVLGAYSSSKFALEGWSEALRIECAPLGIHVCLIEPSAHDSDIWTRNARVAQASERSMNAKRAQHFRQFVMTLPKEDPLAVAHVVVQIARERHPKLRYPVGKMAGAGPWIKMLLPWKRYESALIHRMGVGEV